MGSKDKMEAIIAEEAHMLSNTIVQATQGGKKPLQIKCFFLNPIFNVLWRVTTGKRPESNEPELLKVIKSLIGSLESFKPGELTYDLNTPKITG